MNRRVPHALLTTLCSTLLAAPLLAADMADRIWSGGPILTMNDQAMQAEAIAERGGKILAVGSRAEVMRLMGPDTQLLDLEGRALLPGFVDAHGHVMMGGLQALAANVLAPPDGQVKDMASLQATLRDWMQQNAAAIEQVQLIVGFGYDNATLSERRHPTREDLDAVSKDIPILLVHQSGHLFAVNSKALEVTGISAQTPNPEGGVIRRKSGSQEPNGVLEETAGFPVVLKLLSRVGADGGKIFFRSGTELWARYGYTTAQEGRSVPGTVAMMRQVADAGELKLDVVTYPDVLVDRDFIQHNASRNYTNRLRVGGAKLTIDGSPQGFTAWRDRPYYSPVGDYPKGYRGYPAATPDQVMAAVDWAYANDVQVITHANGEAASDLLIAAHTVAQLKHGADKDRRPVLIHGQFLREDQVNALQRLQLFPSLFPMHTFYWGDWHSEHTVGPELAQNISPTGWVRQRGMRFSTHHDAPVAFPDSMRVLYATVNRIARGSGKVIGPEQRVDVLTALKAMTIWPAWQHFEEDRKGSLEVGKLADFVILSKDPTTVKATTLDQLKVTETIKEGETIYRLKDSQTTRHTPDTLSRLVHALQANTGNAHLHQHGETCPSEALWQLNAALAGESH
ncbi:amidohydrolase [Pseudomonas sp. zbq_18]|uniref:amidohydrolase n=1 Tax=Pseudomonadota TaxID=1224 RepID=UPI00370CE42F